MTTNQANTSDMYPILPTEQELLAISSSLGIDAEVTKLREICSFSNTLEGIHKTSAAKHISIAEKTGQVIDNIILSGVFGTRLDLNRLEKTGYISAENTSEYFQYAQTWRERSRASQKRFLGFFATNNSEDLSLTEKSGVCLIIFQEFKHSGEVSKKLLERFSELSHFLICYPIYIQSLSITDQELFFKLWFKSKEESGVLTDSDSILGKYIIKYFQGIKTVDVMYELTSGAGETVQNTKGQVERAVEKTEISSNDLEEGKDVPNHDELTMLYDIFKVPKQGEIRNKYDAFLTDIQSFPKVESSGVVSNHMFLSGRNKTEIIYNPGDESSVIDNMIQKNGILSMYIFLTQTNITAIKRKKLKRYILGITRILSYSEIAISRLLAAKLIEISPSHEPELRTLVGESSLFILGYPPFIKSRPVQEQDNFFTIYLSEAKNTAQLKEIDSNFWAYLLRYFGNNKVVVSFYNVLLEQRGRKLVGASDKLDHVWNNVVQINGNTYAQRQNRFQSVDELSQAKLSAGIDGGLGIEGIESAGYERSIHIIIYERSNQGRNTKPKFYAIPQGKSIEDIVPKMFLGGKYSYKIFAHKNTNKFRGQKDLPPEVANFSYRNLVTPNQRKQHETKENSGKTGLDSGDRNTVRDARAGKEVNSIKNTDPDLESLDLLIETGDFDRMKVNKDSIDFYYVLTQEELIDYNLSDILKSSNIRLTISESPEVISYLGIDEDAHSPGLSVVSSLIHAAKQEHNKREEIRLKGLRKIERKKRIEIQSQIPEEFRKAKIFLDSCEKDERTILRQGKEIMIWSLAVGNALRENIQASFKDIGFTVQFTPGKEHGIQYITINNTTYDITSSLIPSKMSVTQEINLEYLSTNTLVLEHIIGFILQSYYTRNSESNEKNRSKKINNRVKKYTSERESDRGNLIKKLNGKGSKNSKQVQFVDGWEYFGTEINSEHPEINDHDILARGGFIRVSKSKIKDTTSLWQEEIIIEELKKSDSFCEYIYKRCLHLNFSVPIVKGIVQLYLKRLRNSDSIDEKRAVCIDIIIALKRNNLSIELIMPSGFAMYEIEVELE